MRKWLVLTLVGVLTMLASQLLGMRLSQLANEKVARKVADGRPGCQRFFLDKQENEAVTQFEQHETDYVLLHREDQSFLLVHGSADGLLWLQIRDLYILPDRLVDQVRKDHRLGQRQLVILCCHPQQVGARLTGASARVFAPGSRGLSKFQIVNGWLLVWPTNETK